MSHLPPLVSDLALILITAGVVSILFKLLKQPVVLGYIVAGFLISPHFGLIPNVADMDNITTWAEIGVIFLLFALGLEFSFKKLMAVGGTASIATLINMGSMIIIGYIIGQLMGWTSIESMFLGGMLSMSSTTIIIKAFNDMGLQKKRFAGIVFGMLIVEDLAAILMMVLLSTVAVSQHFQGMELVNNSLKLVFFMVIWFVVGIFLIPTLLEKLKKHLNDETLLIVAVGMCLGMVLFADAVGFSAALGAFIMGSVLAETIEAKHIEHLIEPIKNLFGAVFFVSVGMMIVPDIIVEYAIPILILTLVVLIGRVIFATLGVVASGEGLKVSIQAGFSLAQIGEFSFIIATLGMQLGVISDFIYPIIVAVSVITTFTTPYFIKGSVPVFNYLESKIPTKWETLITGYASTNQKTVNCENDWNTLLKKVLMYVTVYFVLALAVFFISNNLLVPFITQHIPGIWGSILSGFVTLLLMIPFMKAIIRRDSRSVEAKKLWNDNHFNKGALIALNLLRIVLCVVLILMVLIPLFPEMTGVLLLVSVLIALGITFTEGFGKHSLKMEARFFENLNNKENSEERSRSVGTRVKNELLSKNIHLEEIEVPRNSQKVGQTLGELNFKQLTGVNVVSIIRGSQKINIPDGDVRLYPFDRLVVAGTDDDLLRLQQALDALTTQDSYQTEANHQISLWQYELELGNSLIGKTIQDSKIKERTDCLVIGIERDNEDIINFAGDMVLQENDTLWLTGEKDKLERFEANLNN
ncbi:MAG: hypothetical protein RL662_605 [Bacteroidota bacterium]|jgi:CPA2 family monovalent cation:H+ antiporter-2